MFTVQGIVDVDHIFVMNFIDHVKLSRTLLLIYCNFKGFFLMNLHLMLNRDVHITPQAVQSS